MTFDQAWVPEGGLLRLMKELFNDESGADTAGALILVTAMVLAPALSGLEPDDIVFRNFNPIRSWLLSGEDREAPRLTLAEIFDNRRWAADDSGATTVLWGAALELALIGRRRLAYEAKGPDLIEVHLRCDRAARKFLDHAVATSRARLGFFRSGADAPGGIWQDSEKLIDRQVCEWLGPQILPLDHVPDHRKTPMTDWLEEQGASKGFRGGLFEAFRRSRRWGLDWGKPEERILAERLVELPDWAKKRDA